MKIRALTYADVIPLARVSNQAFLEHARYPEHAAQAADRVHDAPDWQWGAFQGSRMLGFLLAEPRPDKTSVAIRLIAAHPAAQGKGVGSRLLATLERQARKSGYPQISVGTPFARKFYERHGFKCRKISLRMIRDITRQPIGLAGGAVSRPLDLHSAEGVLSNLRPDDLKRRFLSEFLRAFRRHRGLAIAVSRRGRLMGAVVGHIPDAAPDLAEARFHHVLDGNPGPVVNAFECAASTLGLRHVGFSIPTDQEATFRRLGYVRSEHDFFWTMYTLRKPLGHDTVRT
jgi:GNAT superfamily N-acetyltransferase